MNNGPPAMTSPTRYALVPLTVDEEMDNSFYEAHAKAATFFAGFQGCWTAALAASPNGGRITAEMLERAAISFMKRWHFVQDGGEIDVADILETDRLLVEDAIGSALTALGLTGADAPAPDGGR